MTEESTGVPEKNFWVNIANFNMLRSMLTANSAFSCKEFDMKPSKLSELSPVKSGTRVKRFETTPMLCDFPPRIDKYNSFKRKLNDNVIKEGNILRRNYQTTNGQIGNQDLPKCTNIFPT